MLSRDKYTCKVLHSKYKCSKIYFIWTSLGDWTSCSDVQFMYKLYDCTTCIKKQMLELYTRETHFLKEEYIFICAEYCKKNLFK